MTNKDVARWLGVAVIAVTLALAFSACAPRHDDGAGDLWIGVREVLKND